MNDTIHKIFMDNIKAYRESLNAMDKAAGMEKSDRNETCYLYHIITCMRHRYGCPYCNSMDKCGCEVIPPKPSFVAWDKGAPVPELW